MTPFSGKGVILGNLKLLAYFNHFTTHADFHVSLTVFFSVIFCFILVSTHQTDEFQEEQCKINSLEFAQHSQKCCPLKDWQKSTIFQDHAFLHFKRGLAEPFPCLNSKTKSGDCQSSISSLKNLSIILTNFDQVNLFISSTTSEETLPYSQRLIITRRV